MQDGASPTEDSFMAQHTSGSLQVPIIKVLGDLMPSDLCGYLNTSGTHKLMRAHLRTLNKYVNIL